VRTKNTIAGTPAITTGADHAAIRKLRPRASSLGETSYRDAKSFIYGD
jgi:hypothetical protein